MSTAELRGRGDWMQTYTGRAFWPLDPRIEDLDIRDIAHALSMICRYGGHVHRFYCPTPEQRVLTADLRWVPAGDLQVGDELLGFDEEPERGTGKNRRKFRPSVVLTAQPVKRQIVRLELEDGSSIRSSIEHPWLVATKQSRNQTWASAGALASALADGRRRYMHRFAETWNTDSSRDGGWMAGIFDGEGHVSFTARRGVQFGVAQRPGRVLHEIEAGFDRLGFRRTTNTVGTSDVQSVQVLGGWREMARLLGTVRPVRLLDKFTEGLRSGHLAKELRSIGAPLEIVAAYDEGEDWCAGLETSTRTYLCEGFGAHNSVAEHCVQMSRAVEPEHAAAALLHDSAEAYLIDLPRPIKRQIPQYGQIEDRLLALIFERYGLPYPYGPEVKDADNRILLDERAALLGPRPLPWASELEALEPLGAPIFAWRPATAEARYLARFAELFPTEG